MNINLSTEMDTFEKYESNVRSYSRSFPTIFEKSKGFKLWGRNGREYIDFFAGAGALNYGHNEPLMKELLIKYIEDDGLTHSLDMGTVAKEDFLNILQEIILMPRKLGYKVMFTGPTGTNSVESALKIARKVTGRTNVMSFTNSFHGMSIGSLSVSSNLNKRKGAGTPLNYSFFLPYEGYMEGFCSITYLEKILTDSGSGVDIPAAIIVETVQGEGGLHTASVEWLKKLSDICNRFKIMLILDEVQTGCGRLGTFFSFENSGIYPDMVCMSKSISGYGLPMAITLIKPEHDQWLPGEHNGTFRGNNLAFITGSAAITKYWTDKLFENSIFEKGKLLTTLLENLIQKYPKLHGERRGRGLMQGIYFPQSELADKISYTAFENGLVCETSGANSDVLKILPPLIISSEALMKGLEIIEYSIEKNI